MGFAVAAIPAFIASFVEFVEAYTIVLAVGTTRGWRAAIAGAVAAVATLALLIGAFGTTLATSIDEHMFELVVGTVLLLFGLRWLRKAILRYSGIVALHDEDLIYEREVAQLRALGRRPDRFDWPGFTMSYKAMLLEGIEVAFIVISLGARGTAQLIASTVGAAVAFIAVGALGVVIRAPLSKVPENTLKAGVGAMLCTFGVFWAAEGVGVHWPGEAVALLPLFAAFVVATWIAVRFVRQARPGGRVVERVV